MDFFRLLSRGARLDDVEMFNKTEPVQSEDQLSHELDFFHTHSHTTAKPVTKKRKTEKAESVIAYGKSKISGPDVPVPLSSFAELNTRFGLNEDIVKKIKFAAPTQIQAEAIPGLLHDRDVLACAPTGSGKTLAYVLPLVHALTQQGNGLRVLVLVPTKELAVQVAETFTVLTRDLKVNVLTKSLLARLTADSPAKPGDVLIATPLRLVRALSSVSFDNIKHLVLDEVDKLFDHTFASQTDAILNHLRGQTIQRMFVSATMPSSTESLVLAMMTHPLRILISPGTAATSVDQKLVYAGSEAGKLLALRQMFASGAMAPPVLIFVQSVERANALVHELIYDGVNVDVIHGDRTESQRRAVVERFKKAEIWVLICTDVLARGVDVKGVNLVVNYDVPQSAQSYIHRIGRTGRAGKEGKAVTFFTKDDVESVKVVVNVMKESGCEVSEWMLRLGKVSKRTRADLKRKPVDRDEISTVPERVKKAEKERKRKKRETQAKQEKGAKKKVEE
ncbi:P-loop containing nucleoside triphosphate hydrolase protein [Lipomyces arxii]|uniref:P-loop containing nucleoside triphosphate hydrolase protein n=1 Tax=Lipomyces arxii TaxID=56418 RepID=UPI0034CE3A57